MLKKATKRRIIYIVVPPLVTFLLRLLYFTCKVSFKGNFDSIEQPNTIYVTWHGELIMTPFCYPEVGNKQKSVYVMTSEHFDGQLIGKIFNNITGGKSVKGSSRRGGVKALVGALRVLKQKNSDLAIAPDGPRGPRHSVAQGVVALSQKLNLPIVAINCKPTSCWKFKTWDNMFLPKPFSKIEFFLSEPFYLDGLNMDDAKQKVKDKLMENAYV